jgi:GT2 family glycosyltransferase
MYGEEADLCLRARALGYRPAITPDATIMHLVGASSSSSIRKTQMVAKARATLIRRHWSALLRPWGVAMLWLWCANRAVAAEVLGRLLPARYKAKRADWRTMWRARGDWLAGYR